MSQICLQLPGSNELDWGKGRGAQKSRMGVDVVALKVGEPLKEKRSAKFLCDF